MNSLSLDAGRQAVRFCNSYSRLRTLIAVAPRMQPQDWLTVLGEEWQACDNISLHARALIDLTPFGDVIESPRLGSTMMTETERAALAALPDEVTVFRGCYQQNRNGLSWSLSENVAAKFPFLHRYQADGEAMIIRATLPRDRIIALKDDREEQEIIAYCPAIIATSRLTCSPGVVAR